MVQVVILDVDGTLMDTNYLHTEAWARAFQEVGLQVPWVEVHKQIGKGSELLVPEFLDDEDAIEQAQQRHSEIYGDIQRRGYPLPGAKELIESLHERGYQVWLVTSAKDEELELHKERLEPEGKIAGIVNSDQVENPKPAPDIFELTLQKAGVDPGDTVSVGDSVWDIESGKKAGVRSVAVLSGGAFSKEELEEAGAIAVYDNCARLLDAGFPENF